MPDDSNGVYALPPGYQAVTGAPILPSQHNPALEDIAGALTNRIPRSGAAPMLGPLKMGGQKIVDAADGVNPSDGATVGQTVRKAGDKMSGSLELEASEPSLWLHRPTVKRGRFTITSAGDLVWIDADGTSIMFSVSSTGAIATKQIGDVKTYIDGVGTAAATAAAAKVAKAGDKMTGALEIESGEPSIWLHRPGVLKARLVLDYNGSLVWVDQSGSAKFYVTRAGAPWSADMGGVKGYVDATAAAAANSKDAAINNRVQSVRFAGYGENNSAGWALDAPNVVTDCYLYLAPGATGGYVMRRYRALQMYIPSLGGWVNVGVS